MREDHSQHLEKPKSQRFQALFGIKTAKIGEITNLYSSAYQKFPLPKLFGLGSWDGEAVTHPFSFQGLQ